MNFNGLEYRDDSGDGKRLIDLDIKYILEVELIGCWWVFFRGRMIERMIFKFLSCVFG